MATPAAQKPRPAAPAASAPPLRRAPSQASDRGLGRGRGPAAAGPPRKAKTAKPTPPAPALGRVQSEDAASVEFAKAAEKAAHRPNRKTLALFGIGRVSSEHSLSSLHGSGETEEQQKQSD